MSYKANVFNVMIASPSDVTGEKIMIREILAEWNIINASSRKIVLLPVEWETHTSPEMGERPQSIINKQILKDCDILVGVFWTRIGSSTGKYESGTVEEIEEHIKTDKPVMLYFSSAPVVPGSVDNEQYAKLQQFRESCKTRGLYEVYDDVNDFKDKFSRQLQLKLNKDEYFKNDDVLADSKIEQYKTGVPDIPNLSKEAKILLKEGYKDSQGNILYLPTLSKTVIATNNKDFVDDNNPRTEAIWTAAVEELESEHLIADRGHKREVFGITKRGYEIAEIINV